MTQLCDACSSAPQEAEAAGGEHRRNSQAYISHLKITDANNIESPFTLAKGCRHSAPWSKWPHCSVCVCYKAACYGGSALWSLAAHLMSRKQCERKKDEARVPLLPQGMPPVNQWPPPALSLPDSPALGIQSFPQRPLEHGIRYTVPSISYTINQKFFWTPWCKCLRPDIINCYFANWKLIFSFFSYSVWVYINEYILIQEVKVSFQSAVGMKWTQSEDINDK